MSFYGLVQVFFEMTILPPVTSEGMGYRLVRRDRMYVLFRHRYKTVLICDVAALFETVSSRLMQDCCI